MFTHRLPEAINIAARDGMARSPCRWRSTDPAHGHAIRAAPKTKDPEEV